MTSLPSQFSPSSSTLNFAFGSGSATFPSISILSSFAIKTAFIRYNVLKKASGFYTSLSGYARGNTGEIGGFGWIWGFWVAGSGECCATAFLLAPRNLLL